MFCSLSLTWVSASTGSRSSESPNSDLPYGHQLRFPAWPLQWLVALENITGTLLVLLFGAIAAGLVKRD